MAVVCSRHAAQMLDWALGSLWKLDCGNKLRKHYVLTTYVTKIFDIFNSTYSNSNKISFFEEHIAQYCKENVGKFTLVISSKSSVNTRSWKTNNYFLYKFVATSLANPKGGVRGYFNCLNNFYLPLRRLELSWGGGGGSAPCEFLPYVSILTAWKMAKTTAHTDAHLQSLNSISWVGSFKDRIRWKLTVKGRTREQTVEGTAVAMVAVADREQAKTSPQYLFQDKKKVSWYELCPVFINKIYFTYLCSRRLVDCRHTDPEAMLFNILQEILFIGSHSG
jgi:hypothetical protein